MGKDPLLSEKYVNRVTFGNGLWFLEEKVVFAEDFGVVKYFTVGISKME